MPVAIVAAPILQLLSSPSYRGRWLDTRTIAELAFRVEYADDQLIRRVRQSLRLQERKGHVQRFGGAFPEWKLTEAPEVAPPSVMAIVEREFTRVDR